MVGMLPRFNLRDLSWCVTFASIAIYCASLVVHSRYSVDFILSVMGCTSFLGGSAGALYQRKVAGLFVGLMLGQALLLAIYVCFPPLQTARE